ncbi:FG-GAP-like repeat-containing protein [Streptomyces sp. NPDC001691]|uniref:FG-GAP-like repeat-containing protein n=1 Tax=Streptomyces sp. NPDC001691 TaxID=3364600 RepID=UPI0036C05A73
MASALSVALSSAFIPLAFGTGVAAAHDVANAASAEVGGASPTGAPTAPGRADAVLASAKARSTGAAVPVSAATTPTNTLTANPDGSFTQTQNLLPVRVNKSGTWVPVDATLRRGADGTIATAATPTALSFSAGGSGPLATMTSPDGKRLALTWPDPLPTPSLSGTSALYSEVLPGVDLRVTAQGQGGFTQVLVVKSPDAARNPKLASLRLRTATSGLTLTSDSAGALKAKDSSGRAAFSAPTPVMWDSSTSTLAPAKSQSLFLRSPAPGGTSDRAAAGPSAGAKQADLRATAGGDGITLTPDQKILTAPDTRFPVYIDPNWIPRNTGNSAWGGIWEAHKSEPWDTTKWDDPGVGYQGWQADTGIERVFYKFDTSFYTGKTIGSATLNMLETYSASIGCEKYGVNVYRADSFNSGISWNTAPSTHEQIGSASVTGTRNNDCPGNQPAVADITSAVASAGNSLSVGVFAADESDKNAFKRFSTNPTLTVQYNSVPNVPTSATTVPSAQAPETPDCGVNAPFGWVGSTNVASDGIHLRANISDPDGNQQVRGQFALWDYVSGAAIIATGDANSNTPWVGNNTTVDKAVGALEDGHTYGWNVRADDGINHSATTAGCHFRIDRTPPSQPGVTSTDYPAAGSSTSPTHVMGDGFQGQFTFTATDDTSGVDHFEYAFNTSLPVGGASIVPATNGSASIKLAPGHWGTNFLDVSAVDKAGNHSQSYEYAFYVPDNLTAHAAPGDLTGDGVPDTAIVDKDGQIRFYAVGTDPAVGVPVATSQAPTADKNWKGAILAHRGAMHGAANVDDLFVLKSGKLYIYLNPGPGNFIKAQATAVPRPSCDTTITDCSSYATDWSQASQIIAAGNVDGDSAHHNDLMTVEGGKLWLFPGNGSGRLLSPILVGADGWNDLTAVAPGDVTGDGLPDLWARDKTTGAMYLYTNRPGDPKGLGDITTRKQISSGLVPLSYPALTSDGDSDGDGVPDLLAVSWDGRLTEFPGQKATDGTVTLGTPTDLSQRGWTTTAQSIEGSPYLPASRSDFNSDARPDMVAEWSDGTLHLYEGDSGGRLASGPQLWDKTWSAMKLMATGDFNGDGNADLVGEWSDGTLHLYLGNGQGGLDTSNVTQLPEGTTWGTVKQLTTGDFNGDGKTDLVAIWGDGSLHLYTNNGTGGLNSAVSMWPGNSWGGMKLLAAGDYNGDTFADILAEWADGTLHLYFGDGRGGLTDAPQMIGGNTWSSVQHLIAGDFSGDGKTDVAAVWGDGSLHLYPGDGAGHLSDPVTMWPDSSWGAMKLVS